MTAPDVPARNPRVAARVVEERALLVTVDNRQLHTLNATGTRVWELCDGRSVDEIAAAVAEEFKVDRATAAADVQSFVHELRQAGALLPKGTAHP